MTFVMRREQIIKSSSHLMKILDEHVYFGKKIWVSMHKYFNIPVFFLSFLPSSIPSINL